MTTSTFSHWFALVQANLNQVGHFNHRSQREQVWFYDLYSSNWIPAYHAARLFVEGTATHPV